MNMTPDRIRAELPADAVRLGQPATLRVTLQPGKILAIAVEQRDPDSHRSLSNERVRTIAEAPRSHVLTGEVSDDGTSHQSMNADGSTSIDFHSAAAWSNRANA